LRRYTAILEDNQQVTVRAESPYSAAMHCYRSFYTEPTRTCIEVWCDDNEQTLVEIDWVNGEPMVTDD